MLSIPSSCSSPSPPTHSACRGPKALEECLSVQEEGGGFTPQAHPGLIGLLASSSAPFRNAISIISRWEYISSKGERVELLPRKKEQESEVCKMHVERRLRSNDK